MFTTTLNKKALSNSVLFNRGSAEHVVGFREFHGFREGSSFFRGNDFCISMLMRHYGIF